MAQQKWARIFAISAVVILSAYEINFFKSRVHRAEFSTNVTKRDVWRGLSVTKGIDPLNCGFEDHFLIPLFDSKMEEKISEIRVTLISEFFNGDGVITALEANLRDNHHHARFVFLFGESPAQQLEDLQRILKNHSNGATISYEVFYAPGGVTHRHLFSVAMLHAEPFLVYNGDIAVDKLDQLLDACSAGLDDGLVVGSRKDAGKDAGPKSECGYYIQLESFDSYLTNRKNFDCDSLNTLKFPPDIWGVENVVASQIPKKNKANVCPLWSFTHHHLIRSDRKRIQMYTSENSWKSSPKGTLEKICDVSLLKTQ